MREVWNKSTEIAGICHALCRHYTRLMPDQATLAGLVHQIGVLPILTFAEENSELLADSISLNHVIERIHPLIGERILRTWDFPVPLAVVPGQHLDFSRDSARVDYVDIVQVATLQSHLGSPHPLATMDWSNIPSFAKLGLDPKADLKADEDLSASMEAAMQMLR
ncbi:HDOD domain protein [compost metagenome]